MPLGDNLNPRIAESTGTTYYVDAATGSDSDDGLSEANAWATLQKAIDTINFGTVSGGALVLVKNHGGAGYKGALASGVDGGTMQFGDLTSGGRTAPDATHVATFEAFPGHAPVLLPPDEDAAGDERNVVAFQHSNARYVRIRGFDLTGDGTPRPGDAPAVTVGGNAHHIEFDFCWVHEVTADDNGSTAKAQGFFLDEASDNVQIWNTRIWAIGDDPTAQANLEHGIYIQGTNHQLVNVVSRDNRNGFGFQLFGDTTHSAPGHKLAHCVGVNNSMSGVTVDGSAYTGIVIANSIFYDNDQSGIVTSNSATVTARNTICNGNATNFSQLSGSTLTQVSTLTSDPLFRDYASRDLRLANGSPAIDHSDDTYSPDHDVDENERPEGAGTDDGAFEFVTPQYLRPDADITDGGWTDDAGGTSLFAAIDETTASDADYIQSELAPALDVCEIRLSDPAETPDLNTDHVLRFRYSKEAGGETTELRARLLQGATEIAVRTLSDIGSAWTTENFAIAEADAADITDYADLRVEFRADQGAGGGTGAEPTWVQSSAGVVDTAGAYADSLAGVAVGNFIIVQVNVDGVNIDGTQTLGACTGVEALDGTAGTMTQLAEQEIGVGASRHILWLGRATGTTVTFNATTAGQDVYVQIHEFADVNTGTTVGDVLENSSAGNVVNGTGNSASMLDTGVTTLGDNRLAVNLGARNDDQVGALASFTGETGGDWILRASFQTGTGTDAGILLQTASMPSAGTVNGGSMAQDSDPWGVIGFALKPTGGAPDARARVSWVELEVPAVSDAPVGGAATISGGGALAAVAAKTALALALLTGGGALSATGDTARSGTASISGGGTLTATGEQGASNFEGTASISGGGTLVASGAKGGLVVVPISGGGAVSSSGTKEGLSSPSISGGGALSSSGAKEASDSTVLSGGGATSSNGTKHAASDASISGGGTFSASSSPSVDGTASLSGGGAVGADGAKGGLGTPASSGGGTVTSSIAKGGAGTALVSADGDPSCSGSRGGSGSASCSTGGSLVASANTGRLSSPLLSGGGTIVATYFAGQAAGPANTTRTRSRPSSGHTKTATRSGRTSTSTGGSRTNTELS